MSENKPVDSLRKFWQAVQEGAEKLRREGYGGTFSVPLPEGWTADEWERAMRQSFGPRHPGFVCDRVVVFSPEQEDMCRPDPQQEMSIAVLMGRAAARRMDEAAIAAFFPDEGDSNGS